MSRLLKTLVFACFAVLTLIAFSQRGPQLLAATIIAIPILKAGSLLSLTVVGGTLMTEITQLTVLQADFTTAIRDVQFNPDGTRLATLNADGFVDIWELSTLKHLFRMDADSKFKRIHGLAFNADGSRLLVTGSADKLARQYAANGTPIPFLVFDGTLTAEYVEGENTIVFSPDGTSYVFGGPDGAIVHSDIRTGRMHVPYGVRGLAVQALLYSPDGSYLVSTHPDNFIRVWDAQTHKRLSTLLGHVADINAIAFSRDSKVLASAGADKTIRLWDIQTGKSLAVLQGDLGTVYGLAFNADGTILASGGTDKQVTLWDVQSATPILVLKSDQDQLGDQGEISAVVFSPGGTMLAVAGEDGTVRLWGVHYPEGSAYQRARTKMD